MTLVSCWVLYHNREEFELQYDCTEVLNSLSSVYRAEIESKHLNEYCEQKSYYIYYLKFYNVLMLAWDFIIIIVKQPIDYISEFS